MSTGNEFDNIDSSGQEPPPQTVPTVAIRGAATRFKPGNQAAKGKKNIGQKMTAAFEKAATPALQKQIVAKCIERALAGEVKWMELLLNRLMGKAHMSVDITQIQPMFQIEATLRQRLSLIPPIDDEE